jgi:hypothetical protein
MPKYIKALIKILIQNEQLTLQAFRLINQTTAKKTFIYDVEHKMYQTTATYINDKTIENLINKGIIRFIRCLR